MMGRRSSATSLQELSLFNKGFYGEYNYCIFVGEAKSGVDIPPALLPLLLDAGQYCDFKNNLEFVRQHHLLLDSRQ